LAFRRKLLILLQDEEKKQQEMDKANRVLRDEVAMLQGRIDRSTTDFAVIESKVKDQLARRTQQLNSLQCKHDQLTAEHRELQGR
jgi:hypothetical protein